jgi:hypothetical protein
MRQALQIAFIVIAATVTAVATPSDVPIEEDLKKLVALFSDGFATSYPQFQHIQFGRIFGSNLEDAVAIFNIEGFDGGNDHHQYLAFFKAVAPDPDNKNFRPFQLVAVTQIGGRAWREFDWRNLKIGPNFVTLEGKTYGPKDAACCPSVPIQVTFQVTNGVISESR